LAVELILKPFNFVLDGFFFFKNLRIQNISIHPFFFLAIELLHFLDLLEKQNNFLNRYKVML